MRVRTCLQTAPAAAAAQSWAVKRQVELCMHPAGTCEVDARAHMPASCSSKAVLGEGQRQVETLSQGCVNEGVHM
jgi:hypothetical protein